jgi:hypothetical protein
MLDGEYVMAMSLPCGYKRNKRVSYGFGIHEICNTLHSLVVEEAARKRI